MTARTRELGELQLLVMNALWILKRATVAEVQEALPGERRPAYTTVLTVLRNLEKRGMVAHEPVPGSRMYRYRPLVSAHDTRSDILQEVLERLFAGSPTLLITHLLQTEAFGPEELREIRHVVDTQERKVTGGPSSQP